MRTIVRLFGAPVAMAQSDGLCVTEKLQCTVVPVAELHVELKRYTKGKKLEIAGWDHNW